MAAQPAPPSPTGLDASAPERTTSAADAEAECGDVGAPAAPRALWLRRFWQRSAEVGRGIVSLTGGLIAIMTVVVGAAIVVESVVEKTVTVRPLSVPKALSDDGMSPEVAALDLRDILSRLVDDVRRGHGWASTEIMDPEELPDVAVPSVGLSAQALAADLRAFFKIQNRAVISGEIVSRDGSHALTLRLNGRPFFRSPRGQPRDRLADMFEDGARATLRLTQPVFAAAMDFDDGDKKQAVAICDGIIGKRKGAQDYRARTLRARALPFLGRPEEAIADDRAIFALYPTAAQPHANLGVLLLDLHRPEEAAAEFRAAIALSPRYARAHTGLGQALLSLGRTDDAMKEFDAGVAIHPEDWWPHLALGDALRAAGRADDALKQVRAAASLVPDQAEPHQTLGRAFRALGQHEEAAAQYRKAAALDPTSAEARRGLAAVLDDLGRHGEAAAERDAPRGGAPEGGVQAKGPESGQDAAAPSDRLSPAAAPHGGGAQ